MIGHDHRHAPAADLDVMDLDPRRLAMLASVPSSDCAAKRPMTSTSFGLTSSICRLRNGSHGATSSGAGLRLPGGPALQHIGDVDRRGVVPARVSPTAASMLSSSRPAWPTNGSPRASSSAARRLADQHPLRVAVPHAEHRLRSRV